jgi:hypothetical protein
MRNKTYARLTPELARVVSRVELLFHLGIFKSYEANRVSSVPFHKKPIYGPSQPTTRWVSAGFSWQKRKNVVSEWTSCRLDRRVTRSRKRYVAFPKVSFPTQGKVCPQTSRLHFPRGVPNLDQA